MPKIHLSQENYDKLTKLAGKLQVEQGGNVTPNDALTFLFENQRPSTEPQK